MITEYHSKEGVPGSFFDCPYGMGVMSTTFCAENHRKSKTKEFIREHKRKDCRFCPLGALHSGERDTTSGSQLYGALLCARCERISNRLVDGRICVSCYNRFAENKKGLNAKGNPLKLIRTYHQLPLLIEKNGSVKMVELNGVMTTSEAVITTLLSDSDGIIFGRAINKFSLSHAK